MNHALSETREKSKINPYWWIEFVNTAYQIRSLSSQDRLEKPLVWNELFPEWKALGPDIGDIADKLDAGRKLRALFPHQFQQVNVPQVVTDSFPSLSFEEMLKDQLGLIGGSWRSPRNLKGIRENTWIDFARTAVAVYSFRPETVVEAGYDDEVIGEIQKASEFYNNTSMSHITAMFVAEMAANTKLIADSLGLPFQINPQLKGRLHSNIQILKNQNLWKEVADLGLSLKILASEKSTIEDGNVVLKMPSAFNYQDPELPQARKF